MILLLWVPFLHGMLMSLHQWPMMGADPKWTGLGNFVDFVHTESFWPSIKATLVYSLSIFFSLAIALIAALVINQPFMPFKSFFAGIMILTYTMPPVVQAVIAMFLLDPELGMIQCYLMEFGIIDGPQYWFTNGPQARWLITFVVSWTVWPFMFLIILSALQSIPRPYYEVAEIYGANAWQRFWIVTAPRLKNAIIVVLILRLAFNLAKIEQPYTLTEGGPVYETSLLGILMYKKAFYSNDLGQGYAIRPLPARLHDSDPSPVRVALLPESTKRRRLTARRPAGCTVTESSPTCLGRCCAPSCSG